MVSGRSIPFARRCVRVLTSKSPGTNTSSKPGAGGTDLMLSKKARTPFWYASRGYESVDINHLHIETPHLSSLDVKSACQSTDQTDEEGERIAFMSPESEEVSTIAVFGSFGRSDCRALSTTHPSGRSRFSLVSDVGLAVCDHTGCEVDEKGSIIACGYADSNRVCAECANRATRTGGYVRRPLIHHRLRSFRCTPIQRLLVRIHRLCRYGW